MLKYIPVQVGVIICLGMSYLGCGEEPVGAPCIPETDKGTFETTLVTGIKKVSIETGSVQCETAACITWTYKYTDSVDNPNIPPYDAHEDTQFKHSFCSCRCEDRDGHKADKNSDKYDDLCECPPNTRCVPVLGKEIEEAPEKIQGSYCIPKCIENICPASSTTERPACVPSKNSDEPWDWHCES